MNKKGFTYSSVLINLLISMLLLPIIVSSFRILSRINLDKMSLQNEIGLMQLRRDLLLGYDFEIDLNSICFTYNGQSNTLQFRNNHLFRSPGTVIYLNNLDYAVFEEYDNHIFLIFYEDEKEFKRIIY